MTPFPIRATWFLLMLLCSSALGQPDPFQMRVAPPPPPPHNSVQVWPHDVWWWDRQDSVRNPESVRGVPFPPIPPALGDRIGPVPPGTFHPIWRGELADLVNEPFAAQLGTLKVWRRLPDRWAAQLDEYREQRDAALHALREKLEQLRGLDPTATEDALEQFAENQAPLLAELADRAERLRLLMTRGDWSTAGVDPAPTSTGSIRDATEASRTAEEIDVLRRAAYFIEGYSIDQRELLREMVLERLWEPWPESGPPAPPLGLLFSPTPARVRLPDDLPPALAADVAAYVDLKAALKRELLDEIYANDRAWLPARRAEGLRQLAERHAPRLAELHAIAESIRQQLVQLPTFQPPVAGQADVPTTLRDRAERYAAARAELQQAFARKLVELRLAHPRLPVSFQRTNNGFGLVVDPAGRDQRKAEVERALQQFNEEQQRHYEALLAERRELEAAWNAAQRPGSDQTSGIDELIAQVAARSEEQTRWATYRDYYYAAVQRGLSPAQRRLLMGAAVQQLMAAVNQASAP